MKLEFTDISTLIKMEVLKYFADKRERADKRFAFTLALLVE